jgi:hypothetical protein
MSAPSRVDRSIVTSDAPSSQVTIPACHAALRQALTKYLAVPIGSHDYQITTGQRAVLARALQVISLLESSLIRAGLLGGGAR